MPEWNEVALGATQAWIAITTVGVLILTLLGLVAAAVLGYARARNALRALHGVAKQYEHHADEPSDLIIKRMVELAAVLNLNLRPEDAAKIVPGFIEIIGEIVVPEENTNAEVVSKAD